ncbi:TIGR03089 family protein [Nakamurella leprariae]|uniref:TIGR03089 family protein n=1 Tax=Nakamurella leprariae TaxID=2803911 RepID=A0A939C1Z8_9ACTN|nr:TIGR03089 family protein [Nakamurella leprariae]MBM9467694.1 hypothetical protein [Nakamurella leprariae]
MTDPSSTEPAGPVPADQADRVDRPGGMRGRSLLGGGPDPAGPLVAPGPAGGPAPGSTQPASPPVSVQVAVTGSSRPLGSVGTASGSVTVALLGPLLALDPHRPRLTAHSADGARVELSTASLANWAAKVAGLLTDELGLAAGSTVVVRTGTRWQTAAILLGAWWAGCAVTDFEDPTDADVADAAQPGRAGAAPSVAFVAEGDDSGCDEVFVVSADPLGAPSHDLEPHQQDFSSAVLPQADRYTPRGLPRSPDAVAVRTGSGAVTVTQLLQLVDTTAAQLPTGSRLLSTGAWSLPHGVAATLLTALAVDGSLVQLPPDDGAGPAVAADLSDVDAGAPGDDRTSGPAGAAGPDVERIAAMEKATATVGVLVPGLPVVR